MQLICLSATVANPDELAGWIGQVLLLLLTCHAVVVQDEKVIFQKYLEFCRLKFLMSCKHVSFKSSTSFKSAETIIVHHHSSSRYSGTFLL